MNEHANASTTLKDIDTTESQSTADLKSTMSEDVANYLREHPQFLVENRELLLDIQVLLSTAGVVSLTQIQSEQYREKIKQLKWEFYNGLNFFFGF